MKIGNKKIGNSVFIIAEAGVNHNNKLDLSFKMVDIAAKYGADAIKFQTWITDEIQLYNSIKPAYQKRIKNKTYYQIIKELEPSLEQQQKIFQRCKKKGIIFLSTPYDKTSVDFLDNLGVNAFKVSSSDMTNHILLRHIAKKKKPIILSTGISNFSQVQNTVKFLEKLNMKNNLILMQATSNYPTPPDDVNLLVIPEYIKTFDLPTGFSDHTKNSIASLGAVALGARVLEKHFTLSRDLPGPDQSSSLEPNELKSWIKEIRYLEKCLGNSKKSLTSSDKKNISMRKILVVKPTKKDAIISENLLTSMRGNKNGVLPLQENLKKILGKKIKKEIRIKTAFSWSMI